MKDVILEISLYLLEKKNKTGKQEKQDFISRPKYFPCEQISHVISMYYTLTIT